MMLIHRRLGFARLLILPLVLILCLYFLVPTFPVHAVTFTVTNVNDAGAGSLRNAVTQANTNPGIDEITFAASGTIMLTSALPTISDDLVINGLGQTVIISGNNAVQPFTINNGVILTLIALTVRNGNAAQGGAILNNGGDVSIYNVTLELNNSTGEGGAIYTSGGTLNVLRSTLENNSSVGLGSAIHNNGSNVIITGSTIAGHPVGDTPVYSTGGSLDILASTFSGNTSGAAGALQFDSGTLNVSNSTFSGNTGTTSGALLLNGGTVTIQNATFGDNTGTTAGGIVPAGGTITLQNTILDNALPNCSAFVTTANNNLENDVAATCDATAVLGDPLLLPLANNGGPTQTRALDTNGVNPALNAGDNTICAAPPVNNHDQRCFGPRPTPCSIGAYEPAAVSAVQNGELELAFGAAEIVPGGSAPLTFTFTNGGSNFAWLNQISFVNSLPVGLSFVPGSITPNCTQLPIVSGSTFFIAGLSLQPGETCTITVNVTSTAAGAYTTTADTAFSAETGITITNDSLTVRAQTSGGNTGSVQVSTIPETVTRLPSTGYPPQQPNTDWQLMVLGIASLLLVSSVTLLLSKLHKY